jgi:hypothetical protein
VLGEMAHIGLASDVLWSRLDFPSFISYGHFHAAVDDWAG